MSRFEEIKDEYAVEQGFVDFNEMYLTFGLPISEKAMEDISQRYARECCMATQQACANNVVMIDNQGNFTEVVADEIGYYIVDKQSITNPDNIILL